MLLLDEPLGALDLKLREQMQVELKEIQREVGITFLFVTHDQEEALTMSDRIAVFNDGRIEQVGSPAEVYERPATPFVAGFVGTSNLLRGPVAEQVARPYRRLVGPAGEDPHRAGGRAARPRRARGCGHGRARWSTSASATRFLVDLDAGAELVALQQNLQTSSMDVQRCAACRVQLIWKKEHEFEVRAADAASDGRLQPTEPDTSDSPTTGGRRCAGSVW